MNILGGDGVTITKCVMNIMGRGWGHQYWICHEYHGGVGGITNTVCVMNILGGDGVTITECVMNIIGGHQHWMCHIYHRGEWSSILDVSYIYH